MSTNKTIKFQRHIQIKVKTARDDGQFSLRFFIKMGITCGS